MLNNRQITQKKESNSCYYELALHSSTLFGSIIFLLRCLFAIIWLFVWQFFFCSCYAAICFGALYIHTNADETRTHTSSINKLKKIITIISCNAKRLQSIYTQERERAKWEGWADWKMKYENKRGGEQRKEAGSEMKHEKHTNKKCLSECNPMRITHKWNKTTTESTISSLLFFFFWCFVCVRLPVYQSIPYST